MATPRLRGGQGKSKRTRVFGGEEYPRVACFSCDKQGAEKAIKDYRAKGYSVRYKRTRGGMDYDIYAREKK